MSEDLCWYALELFLHWYPRWFPKVSSRPRPRYGHKQFGLTVWTLLFPKSRSKFLTHKSLMFTVALDIQWISKTRDIKSCMFCSSVDSNFWEDPQSFDGVFAHAPQYDWSLMQNHVLFRNDFCLSDDVWPHLSIFLYLFICFLTASQIIPSHTAEEPSPGICTKAVIWE